MRAKAVEVSLDPVDNQRLARLCGALDENLRQIESALEVTIARRGAGTADPLLQRSLSISR